MNRIHPAITRAAKVLYQHTLKEEITLDAEPFATIPAGTPIFGEETNGFVVFQFGEHKRQILTKHFENV